MGYKICFDRNTHHPPAHSAPGFFFILKFFVFVCPHLFKPLFFCSSVPTKSFQLVCPHLLVVGSRQYHVNPLYCRIVCPHYCYILLLQSFSCQAQLKLSAQLKAELVLFPLAPATHPPTRESLFLSSSYSKKHSGA